jgi:pantoate--beta-alanine ligase
MRTFFTISELRDELKQIRKEGKTIGFVPTMGYLHEGHLSLLKRAKAENDVIIISIFVNPTQFGRGEDFDSYPNDLERDSILVESVGADIIFAPLVREMYPNGYSTFVDVEGTITQGLCGRQRPGHFKGVATIVSKLFNIIDPDAAYFGQKDAQQVCAIEQMVKDMNFPVRIVTCPTVREANGLALSSRNAYLNQKEREEASVLSKSLQEAKRMVCLGERDATNLKRVMTNLINTAEDARIEYIEIVNAKTLQSMETVKEEILIALAVCFGKTRLIDNIRLDCKS